MAGPYVYQRMAPPPKSVFEDKENQRAGSTFTKEKRSLGHNTQPKTPLQHLKKKKIEIPENSSEEHRSGSEYSDERLSNLSSEHIGSTSAQAPKIPSTTPTKRRNPILKEVEMFLCEQQSNEMKKRIDAFEKNENPVDIRNLSPPKSLLIGDGWKRDKPTGRRIPALSWKFTQATPPQDPRGSVDYYLEQLYKK